MSLSTEQHKIFLDQMVSTKRPQIRKMYLSQEEHVRAASDDYRYRDGNGRLLYAVVRHKTERDVADTELMTRSLHEALRVLDGPTLASGETRQIRIGGVPIALRRSIQQQERLTWLGAGVERFTFDDAGIAAIAAADVRIHPTGARVGHDEIRLQPIPRMPSYAEPREVDGEVLTRDLEAVLQTAENGGEVGTDDVDRLEQLAVAIMAAQGDIRWNNEEAGRHGIERPHPSEVIRAYTSRLWHSLGSSETVVAYASALLDHTVDRERRDEALPPTWAKGYLDAGRRAELLGDHLLFGRETLPPGITPAIRPAPALGGLHEAASMIREPGDAALPASRAGVSGPAAGTLKDKKQAALDALDHLLGEQVCTKSDKAEALREIAVSASRMATNVAQWARESARLIDENGATVVTMDTLTTQVLDQAARARERLEDTSEDSYVTRNELHGRIKFLNDFSKMIRTALPGGTVDLSVEVVDHGYDAEEAAADQSCGLEYVPDIERKRSAHEMHLESVQDVIDSLRKMGVKVRTDFTALDPRETYLEEEDEQAEVDPSEMYPEKEEDEQAEIDPSEMYSEDDEQADMSPGA